MHVPQYFILFILNFKRIIGLKSRMYIVFSFSKCYDNLI